VLVEIKQSEGKVKNRVDVPKKRVLIFGNQEVAADLTINFQRG